MDYKLKKYKYKLSQMQNIYYYFNTYNKPIPAKYTKLLNIIKYDFSYIQEATTNQYKTIRNNVIELCQDNYHARAKLDIGSFNIIFTIFILTDKVESVINFIITNNNKCYIETICGFSNNILINILKKICYIYGLSKIEIFSTYDLEYQYLLQNNFKLVSSRLEYEL
jgi:hypothetical protein